MSEKWHKRAVGWKGWGCAGVLLVLSACGDDGPTSATPRPRAEALAADHPAGTSLRIVSGGTDKPVAGAELIIGGDTLVSDVIGRVVLRSDFNTGAFLDIHAGGFLPRRTVLPRLGSPYLSLWPVEGPSGLTEEFILNVVYNLSSDGESRLMMRIWPGTDVAYVVPSRQIRSSPVVMETVAAALGVLNEVGKGELTFVIEPDPPPDSVVFELVVDPGELPEGTAAQARRKLSGWNIVGGTIVYDSLARVYAPTTYHELGHMMGLGHSDSPSDVMSPGGVRRVGTFSTRERYAMRIMLDRPAETQPPDNDRHVTSSRSLSNQWVSVIDCYE